MSEFNPKDWVVVTSGPLKYLGKLSQATEPGTHNTPSQWAWENIQKVVAARRGWLTLNPAYEFFTPLTQNGNAIARQAIVTPFEHTLEPTPLFVRADALHWLGNLQPDDLTPYKGFVATVEAQIQQAKARRSGLTIPSPNTGGLKLV